MVDDPAGLHVVQRFERQAPMFLLLVDPGRQGLLDDPTARAFQAGSHPIHLFREGQRHMGSQHFGFHRAPFSNQT